MNTIPAQEIKRRGISAVDQALKKGPVHVIKNNQPKYVILTEEAYKRLADVTQPGGSIWEWLERRPWKGTRSREDIDAQIREERESWGER